MPRLKPFTILPEFAHLRGKKAFDGRSYDTICGSAGDQANPVIAVPEENLLGLSDDPCGKGEDIMTHEGAHAVMDVGFDYRMTLSWRSIYLKAKQSGQWDPNSYLLLNFREYWACLSEGWLNVSSTSVCGVANHQELVNKDLDAATFIESVYGPLKAN